MMNRLFLAAFLIATAMIAYASAQPDSPIPIADVQRAAPVDFAEDILPLLKRNCVACHRTGEAEGGLNLTTHSGVLKGGDSGAAVNTKESNASLLLLRASGRQDDLMPPEDNDVGAKPLTPDELGLIALWIRQGATEGSQTNERIEWQPIPESVRTIYSLATSPDGRFAAVARANRVAIHDALTGAEIVKLVDPSIESSSGLGAASVDVIQSLAFSPDGQRLASGGYRTVRIWKRSVNQRPLGDRVTNKSAGWVAFHPTNGNVAIENSLGDIEVYRQSEDRPRTTLSGHSESITGMVWAGERLASCDSSGRLLLWGTTSGEKLAEANSANPLRQLSVSHDGTHLFAVRQVDDSGKIQAWRIQQPQDDASNEAGLVPHEFAAFSKFESVNAIAHAQVPVPSLIVATKIGPVFQISLNDGSEVRKLDASQVTSLHSNGDFVVTADSHGNASIWNLRSGKLLRSLESDSATALRLAVAQRNFTRQQSTVKRLNAGTATKEAAVNKEAEATKRLTQERDKAIAKVAEQTKKGQEAAEALATAQRTLAQTRSRIAKAESQLANESPKLEQWQGIINQVTPRVAEARGVRDTAAAMLAAAEESLKSVSAEMTAAQKSLTATRTTIESAKKTITDGKQNIESLKKQIEAQQKTIEATNKAKGPLQVEVNSREQALAAAADSQRLAKVAVASHKSRLATEQRREQELSEIHQRAQSERDRLRTDSAVAVTIDASGRVAMATKSGTVRVYDLAGNNVVSLTDPLDSLTTYSGVAILKNQVCAFGPGRRSFTWSFEEGWRLEQTLGSPEDSTISHRVTALDFRPDGLSIAVGSGPPSRFGDIKIYALSDRRLLRDLGQVHSDTVLGLKFSPDGRTLASCSADNAVRLLSPVTGKVIRSLDGHTHHVLGAAWQDDGQTLASGSSDNQVRIWNVDDGKQRRKLGLPKEVTAISFVQDSSRIATACADGNCRLHDTTNGNGIRSFNAHGDFLYALAVTPDGERLFAGGQNGVLRLFRVSDGQQLGEWK